MKAHTWNFISATHSFILMFHLKTLWQWLHWVQKGQWSNLYVQKGPLSVSAMYYKQFVFQLSGAVRSLPSFCTTYIISLELSWNYTRLCTKWPKCMPLESSNNALYCCWIHPLNTTTTTISFICMTITTVIRTLFVMQTALARCPKKGPYIISLF